MRLTNYTSTFSGAEQNPATLSYIYEIVRSLIPRVPAESSFSLNISQDKSSVVGRFTIIAASMKFESKKESKTAVDVMDLIFVDIQSQIEFWIEKRVI